MNKKCTAQFYKCALQVNPASYIKYRGKEQLLTEEQYNQELLKTALAENIKIIGLADHGAISGFEKIRDLFAEHQITVFPGFEIASSEKVHFVCLFDEDTTPETIIGYLGALGVDAENPVAPIPKSGNDIIEFITKKGGFIYAAHCTNDDGVLYRRMNHIWKLPKLIAAQIPATVDDLKKLNTEFYSNTFLNKDTNYQRSRSMVAINALDIAEPSDLAKPSASCLIKMTKPCFESFKQAFYDAESRIKLNYQKILKPSSIIKDLVIIGEHLPKIEISFSENLNCLIGSRGVGKSTIIECIKYAFEIEPINETAKIQHHSIIKNNLGKNGLIRLSIHSNNQTFIISKKYGEPTCVSKNGKNIDATPKELMPDLLIFSKNDIYELAANKNCRNKFINNYLESKTETKNKTLALQSQLKCNRELLLINQHPQLQQELLQERKKLLGSLIKTCSTRTKFMRHAINKINEKLQGKMLLTVAHAENKQNLIDFLTALNLPNITQNQIKKAAIEKAFPRQIIQAINHGAEQLMALLKINRTFAEELCKLPKAELLKLEEILFEDYINIELKINNSYKDISQTSTGQQCTAILNLALLSSDAPLIIDQPEDNLDNAFIAESIVTKLRIEKETRQFLFATHNANIPIYGDAEWIGILTNENSKGVIKENHQGGIDIPEIQQLALHILEGSKTAFIQRQEKYGIKI